MIDKPLDKKYPRLTALLTSGELWIDRGEYIGRATDGTECAVGTVGCEASAERYLTAHPGPDEW